MSDARPASLDWMRTLIGFDTTSRDSNLDLIHHVKDYLAGLGVAPALEELARYRVAIG